MSILSALLLQSCVSWKKLDKVIKNEPPAQSFSSVRFYNYAIPDSVETYKYYSFHQLNKMNFSRKDSLAKWKEIIVQLDSLEKGLSVSFFQGDVLADRYFLKGKWKDSFFYAKRRTKARGIPPIFFFYNEKLSVLGNYGTHLSLFQSDLRAGMIMLFSAGGQDNYRERYEIKAD